MVSVLHEEVEYKVEKLKYKKLEVMQLKTQTWTPRVNKRPSQTSPYEVLQSWLIDKSFIYQWRIIWGRGGRA